MSKINSKNFLLALLGICVLLIFFKFFSIMSFPDAQILDRDKIQKIFPGQTFSQRFVASRSNLETLQFLLRTPGIKDGDTVSVKLTDETCANTLRDGVLETPFLNSDNLSLFTFSRVPDSEGKVYCILLSFTTTNAPSKYLRFFTVKQENPSLLLMNVATHDAVNGQALSLRPVYRNDHFWQDLAELNRRVSQYKPWFLKDFFMGILTTLFIVLSLALLVSLIGLGAEDEKKTS